MRYDKTIYFCKDYPPEYNDETGDYEDVEPLKTERMANINDLGIESMNMLYGKVVEGALIMRIKTPIYDEFDYILYDGKKYGVKVIKSLRQEQTFNVAVMQ